MVRKSPKRGNRLLASLSAKSFASLEPHLVRVTLTARESLSRPGRPITSAYFPESGMISLVQALEDGTAIEVGLIGREGFWGVPVLLGARSSPLEAMVQGDGVGLQISAAALVAEAARNDELRDLLLRYSQALLTQVAQTAACNGRHSVQQRLARWLLDAANRLDGDTLALSHEFLSYMLGCRRSGVTVALGGLSDKGAVAVKRESIRIADRDALEEVACECYRSVQSEFRRLLP